MRLFAATLAVGICCLARSQSELLGLNHFPETRQLSGLPGGSFGVLPNGNPSFRGAMALSTPIAYSLDHWHWAIGINSTSTGMGFRSLDVEAHGTSSSGTGEIMVGIPTAYGAITVTSMPISIHMDELATNILFTPRQSGRIVLAAGVQDVFNNTHTFQPKEPRPSRSPFVVSTAQVTPGGYVSVGYGNQRFGGVFGNLSQTFGSFKAVAEYDTYNWNYGVGHNLGHFRAFERDIHATLFGGYIRGKYATWSLAFTF